MTLAATLLLIHLYLAWPAPVLADVGTSFTALATQLAGDLTGALAIVAVFSGYALMTAGEDVQQATRAQRALGLSLAGGVAGGRAVPPPPVRCADSPTRARAPAPAGRR